MNKFSLTAIAVVTSVLAACGGGGGGTTAIPTPTPVAKAEGVYAGTLNSGGATGVFSSVILEDDSVWSIYGVAGLGGSTIVQGFVAASGTSSNGTYSAAGKDYFYTGAVVNGTVNATYSPGISISGTVSGASGNASFSGTTANATGYNYNTPAQLSSIVGTWSGSSLSGGTTSVVITSTGAYTARDGACAISGTLTPRPSGKNIFNVTYSNGVTGCAVPNASAQGIGIVSTLNTGKLQLIVALTNADKSAGTVVFVTK